MFTSSFNMDEIDHALIGLLRQDARMSVADLAHKLKVSRGTVTNRIRKMEEQQIIVGYTVRLRPEAEPERIRLIKGIRSTETSIHLATYR